jgi:hypothetical protein
LRIREYYEIINIKGEGFMDRSRKLMAWGGLFSVASLTGLFLGLVELLLALRVFLKFFFTTADSGFVHWAFATTDALVSPLRGMFVNPASAHGTNWYVDFPALFAMAAYAVLVALMVALAVSWRTAVPARRR